MTRSFVDFWMKLPNSGRAIMALVVAAVFSKWARDDFKNSQVSARTWMLVAVAGIAFVLAITALLEPSN
jgi:hypothetical protein